MKKKLLSVMALTLCLSMSMSVMTACDMDFNSILSALNQIPSTSSVPETSSSNKENTNSSTPDNSSSNPDDPGSKPTTGTSVEDEILAKVGEAYKNAIAYDGAFTMHCVATDHYQSGGESETEGWEMVISVDPATNRMYEREDDDVAKMFKNGDTYYLYEGRSYGEDSTLEETYQGISEAYAGYCISEMNISTNFDALPLGSLFNIQSVTEFNDAMDVVIADAVENSSLEGITGNAELKVTCMQDLHSRTVEFLQEIEAEVQEDGVTEKEKMTYTGTFIEKDGKWVNFRETMEVVGSSNEGGSVTESYYYMGEYFYSFSYDFDQTGYDSVEVSVPMGVETRGFYDKSFNVVVNGIKANNIHGSYGAATVQEAMTDVLNAWNYNYGDGVSVVWYKDEACTQEINAETITEKEYFEIDTLYGKATLGEGYVFVVEKTSYGHASGISKAYEIYFNAIVKAYYTEEDLRLSVINVGADCYFENADKIYLNGSTTTAEFFTVESGKTYNVEYHYLFNQDDVSLLSIGFDIG